MINVFLFTFSRCRWGRIPPDLNRLYHFFSLPFFSIPCSGMANGVLRIELKYKESTVGFSNEQKKPIL